MGTLAQSLAGAAVAIATASNAFAADGSRLGLPDGEHKLYVYGVGSTSITEVCAPKEGDIVCKMNIVFGSEGRAFEDKTEVLHGYGRDGEAGNVISKAPELTYKADGSGIEVTQAGKARHISARSDRVLMDDHKTGTRAFRAQRKETPFDPKDYKVEGATLTPIERAMREAGAIGSDPKYRLIDGVSRFSKDADSISETSCKLVPPAGADPKKIDLDVSGAERTICLTRIYNAHSDLSNPYEVNMTLSIHALNADGKLMTATIEDARPAGIGANNEITGTDKKRAEFALERMAQGLNYTAR